MKNITSLPHTIIAIGMAGAMVTACGRSQPDQQAAPKDSLQIVQATPAAPANTSPLPVLNTQQLAEQNQVADTLKTCVAQNLGIATDKVQVIKAGEPTQEDAVKVARGMVISAQAKLLGGEYSFTSNKSIADRVDANGFKTEAAGLELGYEPTAADYGEHATRTADIAARVQVCFKNFKGYTFG